MMAAYPLDRPKVKRRPASLSSLSLYGVHRGSASVLPEVLGDFPDSPFFLRSWLRQHNTVGDRPTLGVYLNECYEPVNHGVGAIVLNDAAEYRKTSAARSYRECAKREDIALAGGIREF